MRTHAPELLRLEQSLARRDFREVEAVDLLAADFTEIGRSGRRYSREEAVARLRDARPVEVVISDFRTRLLAPGVVLVAYRAEHRHPRGIEHTLRSSVWVWREDRWQVTFHQGTPAAATG